MKYFLYDGVRIFFNILCRGLFALDFSTPFDNLNHLKIYFKGII